MKKLRLLFSLLLIIATFTAAIPFGALTVNAATITKTVNLATVSKNARGDGYDWANLTDTLTLDNLNINTADEFGMKLPANATVVLKGDNYITAASVGLVCTGQVVFEGDGTLTITAGDVGIDFTGVQTGHLSRFRSGSITVTAGNVAIRSIASELSFMGTDISLNVNGEGEGKRAVSGKTININGSDFKANGQVYASNALNITGVNAEVSSSNGAALECPGGIRMTNVEVSAGSDAGALQKVETYNGESIVSIVSTVENKQTGVLFGGKFHRAWDYVAFIALLLAVTALIAVPIYLKKKKTKKLIEEYKAANPPKKNKASSSKNQKTK